MKSPTLSQILCDRWAVTWSLVPFAARDLTAESDTLEHLLIAYAEPHRSYHTGNHLRECFTVLDSVTPSSRLTVEFALWFHDAVYNPLADVGVNEDESGVWAFRALKNLPFDVRREVRRLITLTTHGGAIPSLAEDPAGALLVDVDLSILGATPERFGEYEAQVRAEYAHVPEPVFREARAALLESFLGREALFVTPALAERLEERARSNLRESIAKLRAPAGD